ncbi:hypothetical protein PSA5_09215 [Pseudomonas syringae pv. actinidiae]|nr:hypothetical protein PSA5_09215 [Pseudomonas syringae pv. actinidiae]
MFGKHFGVAALQGYQLSTNVAFVEDKTLGEIDVREIMHKKWVSEVMTVNGSRLEKRRPALESGWGHTG